MTVYIMGAGAIISIAGMVAGFILITKASSDIEKIVGASILIESIIVGIIFFSFAYLLAHIELLTKYVKEIRNHFYPDKAKEKDD